MKHVNAVVKTEVINYIILCLLCLTLGSSCVTMQAYTGDQLPKEEVAIIKTNMESWFRNTWISEIDGKPVDIINTKIEVLPGIHTLRIQVKDSEFAQPVYVGVDTITFEAKAGHVYRIDGKVKRVEAVTWIIDEETNAPVTRGMKMQLENLKKEEKGL
jgi:hypothetical protein